MLRRDIYDRPPVFKWTKQNVILLGDSAHAMQPNLGQGGCMAIEDAYQLAKDLHQETQAFKEPWFNLERILVVRSCPRCAVTLTHLLILNVSRVARQWWAILWSVIVLRYKNAIAKVAGRFLPKDCFQW